MAKQVSYVVEDDIDGTPGAMTYRYGWGGQWFEIDLAATNAKQVTEFFEYLRPYSRPARGRPAPGRARKRNPRMIRQWWRDNEEAVRQQTGRDFGANGKIPDDVEELYDSQPR